MKDLYIPKGRTLRYESLACRNIVNYGVLEVDKSLQARNVSGNGIVKAGSVSARHVSAMDVETGSVTANTLAAERVYAAEVKVTDEAVVSCFLEAEYAQIKRLTVASFDVQDLHAEELRFLPRQRQSVLAAVIGDFFRSILAFLRSKIPQDALYTQVEESSDAGQHADTNQSKEDQKAHSAAAKHATSDADDDLKDDFEFLRLKALYRFLRHQGQGYTLRVVPRETPPTPPDPAGSAAQGSNLRNAA